MYSDLVIPDILPHDVEALESRASDAERRLAALEAETTLLQRRVRRGTPRAHAHDPR